jgi:hypothetical protein
MTDHHTLKRIIGEQRGTIEKQKAVIDELNENYTKLSLGFEHLADKIEAANKFLETYTPNMIGWKLAKTTRCILCSIEDCSTKGSVDPEECLLSNQKPTEDKL